MYMLRHVMCMQESVLTDWRYMQMLPVTGDA